MSFTDSGLARAKGYSYKVKAVKKSGGKEYISASYSKAVEAVTNLQRLHARLNQQAAAALRYHGKLLGVQADMRYTPLQMAVIM